MHVRDFAHGVALLLLAVFLQAGGNPYGGEEPLWRRYFETDPGDPGRYGYAEIPRGNRERCLAVRELFSEIGGSRIAVEPSDEGPGEGCPGNVIMALGGRSPDTIIVSAHLDRSGSGQGAVDDFSGVVMLGMLYLYFKDRPHQHTLVFAAFDGEEAGSAGSTRFIEKIRRMPERVTAVVNLECLGVTLPRPWAEGSSDWLESLFVETAGRRGLFLEPVSIKGVRADSIPFLLAGLPAITIQGIEPEQIKLLGTLWDRRSAVRGDIFDTTFLVLAEFIDTLDTLSITPNPAKEAAP